VFVTDAGGEQEVSEVFSRAYFQPTKVNIRAELQEGQRAFLLGWAIKYESVAYGEQTHTEYTDSLTGLDITDETRMVSPIVNPVKNYSPLWLTSDVIIFHSNRDGGDGLWAVKPAGGKAYRLTEPERDSSGNIAQSHRGDSWSVVAAWSGTPIAFFRLTSSSANSTGEGLYIAKDQSASRLDLNGFGNAWRLDGRFCLLSGAKLACFLTKGDSGGGCLYSCAVFLPDGTFSLTESLSSSLVELGAAGNSPYVFMQGYKQKAEDKIPTSFSVLDTESGLLHTPQGLQSTAEGYSILNYSSSSIAANGRVALLTHEWLDENGTSLGSSVAIVGADGSAVKLPLTGDYFPLFTNSIRLSPDGTSFTGNGSVGWRRYSAADGSLLETLSTEPADASPSWNSCTLQSNCAQPESLAAGVQSPDGTATVSAAANGRNTDLEITNGTGTRWVTGPESEDVE
jgi:hypothetical protein